MTSAFEANADGLIGPDPLLCGPVPRQSGQRLNKGEASNPRAAVLQGLHKMKLLADLGVPQFVLPPARAPQHPVPARPRLLRLGQGGAGAGLARRAVLRRRRLFGQLHVGRQRRHGDPQRRHRGPPRPLHPGQSDHQPAPGSGGRADHTRPQTPSSPTRTSSRSTTPCPPPRTCPTRARPITCACAPTTASPASICWSGAARPGRPGTAPSPPARPAKPAKPSSAATPPAAPSWPARAAPPSPAAPSTTTWSASERARPCCSTSWPSRTRPGRRTPSAAWPTACSSRCSSRSATGTCRWPTPSPAICSTPCW